MIAPGELPIHRRGNILLCMLMASFLVSCDPPSSPSPMPNGHYEGTVLERIRTKGSEESFINQQPVCTDISYEKDGTGNLRISNAKQEPFGTIQISKAQKGGFRIRFPKEIRLPLPPTFLANEPDGQPDPENSTLAEIANQEFDLTQEAECYMSRTKAIVRFCLNSEKFLLEVTETNNRALFTLSGDHFSHAAHFTMEPPRDFTLKESIESALGRNFDSRIEFEHSMQAKHLARAAYLNLLPHLSLSSVLSNLTPSVMSIFSAIGDLLPFLLPTRWFQAKEAALKSAVEADSLLLMRADLATQIEGLVYALQRNELFFRLHQELLKRALQARELAAQQEAANKLPAGSADHLTTVVDSLTLDASALRLLIKKDRATLGLYPGSS